MAPKGKTKKSVKKVKASTVVDALSTEDMNKDQAKPAKRGSATVSFGDLSKISRPTESS